jgi:hypothetical protein
MGRFSLPAVYAFSTDNCAEEAYTMKANRFVIRPKLLVAFASLALLPLAAGVAAQQEPYPEHGQVIATRLGAEAVGSADSVGSLKRWIYWVDCGDLYYDLQGGRKPSLTVGQNVTQ